MALHAFGATRVVLAAVVGVDALRLHADVLSGGAGRPVSAMLVGVLATAWLVARVRASTHTITVTAAGLRGIVRAAMPGHHDFGPTVLAAPRLFGESAAVLAGPAWLLPGAPLRFGGVRDSLMVREKRPRERRETSLI